MNVQNQIKFVNENRAFPSSHIILFAVESKLLSDENILHRYRADLPQNWGIFQFRRSSFKIDAWVCTHRMQLIGANLPWTLLLNREEWRQKLLDQFRMWIKKATSNRFRTEFIWFVLRDYMTLHFSSWWKFSSLITARRCCWANGK